MLHCPLSSPSTVAQWAPATNAFDDDVNAKVKPLYLPPHQHLALVCVSFTSWYFSFQGPAKVVTDKRCISQLRQLVTLSLIDFIKNSLPLKWCSYISWEFNWQFGIKMSTSTHTYTHCFSCKWGSGQVHWNDSCTSALIIWALNWLLLKIQFVFKNKIQRWRIHLLNAQDTTSEQSRRQFGVRRLSYQCGRYWPMVVASNESGGSDGRQSSLVPPLCKCASTAVAACGILQCRLLAIISHHCHHWLPPAVTACTRDLLTTTTTVAAAADWLSTLLPSAQGRINGRQQQNSTFWSDEQHPKPS